MKKKKLVEEPARTLPTEDSLPCEDLQDYSILLFGEKKIGKTTLTAQFPSTYHMMFEPGGKSLRIRQNPVVSWKEAKQDVLLLRKNKFYKTVVIDTADHAYRLCVAAVCKRLGVDHPSDEGYGKGWEAARDEFTVWVNDILSLGKGVTFVSHATEKEISKRSGVKYHKILPTMSNQARDVLEPVVDIWAYYGYEGDNRILTIRGDEHVGAGHRLTDHFKGVKEISMGRSPEEAYKNFVDAFNNKYKSGKPTVKLRRS